MASVTCLSLTCRQQLSLSYFVFEIRADPDFHLHLNMEYKRQHVLELLVRCVKEKLGI